DPLPLHSFPTRRSSDLGWDIHRGVQSDTHEDRKSVLVLCTKPASATPLIGRHYRDAQRPSKWDRGRHHCARRDERDVPKFTKLRSEEHTSELQSRENLV